MRENIDPQSPAFMTESELLLNHREKLAEFHARLPVIQARRLRALLLLVLVAASTLALALLALIRGTFPLFYAAVPFVGLVYLCRHYMGVGKEWRRTDAQSELLRRSISRIEGYWVGEGSTGQEFARSSHLYQWDLNILGRGSLYELLCTTKTALGAERLAQFLLDPCPLEASIGRQEAVHELRSASLLREQVHLLGDYRSQDCTSDAFTDWLSTAPIAVADSLRIGLLVCSGICCIVSVGVVARILAWQQWLPLVAVLVVVQLATAGIFLKQVQPSLRRLRLLTNAFTVLQQGLALLEQQEFHSSKLRSIVQTLRSNQASTQLKTLERIVRGLDQREKPMLEFLLKSLAAGTQFIFAVDRWRLRHERHLLVWMDAWAEFEASSAIATYAFEHPQHVFPVLERDENLFDASSLGNPLIPQENRVCNDISLGLSQRFYFISGSNMAGKSTLLRSIGLNAVLAFAGGPVCASGARISGLSVCASLAITDSLVDGKSKFLAEVERLGSMIALGKSGAQPLFLIDEILSGTNSEDRRIASETVLRSLLRNGALGALSTHDLALSEIVSDVTLQGVLVHMQSTDPGDPLAFDYLLKPGQSEHSNALAILRMIGIE